MARDIFRIGKRLLKESSYLKDHFHSHVMRSSRSRSRSRSMRFLCYQRLFSNRKWVRWPDVRHSHSDGEILPMKKLNILSYAPVEYRNSMISQIETAVTASGGYVDDFNFFSDLAVSLRILGLEQPDTLRQFFRRLRSDINGLRLDKETVTILHNASTSGDRFTLFILFQILFVNAKGEMRQVVPAVNS